MRKGIRRNLLLKRTIPDIEFLVSIGERLTPGEQKVWDSHQASESKKRKRRGLKLQAFRQRIGVSQSTLARLLRVSRRSVNYYESGEKSPRLETQAILLYLGYDWSGLKWSRRRFESIHCAGEIMESPSVDGVLTFFFWWCYDKRGYELSDYQCKRLGDALERRLIYTKRQ